MQLKTILNRLHRQPGFVYGKVRLLEGADGLSLEVDLEARTNGRPICSGCGVRRPGYDRLDVRRFDFVPMWGMPVAFCYAMRRADCPRCGVTVEMVPWAEGKNHVTIAYAWFLAAWAKRLSWKEVAEAFRTTWENVFKSVEMAVAWGREHQDLTGITAVGIDEIHWSRRGGFLTLVYQIDEGCRRLLWVGRERRIKTLLRFFRWFGKPRTAGLKFICSDMWKPYLRVVAKKAGHAIHVLDRFHIMSHMSKAIDEIRADEVRSLKKRGVHPFLKHARWLLLKRVENLTDAQDVKLADLIALNLRSVRAYLLKEWFQYFWEYQSPHGAGVFLDSWCTRTMRSKLEPMKKVARMLRGHRPLILNWFRVRGTVALGAVEGFNNKAKVTTRKAYGYRTYRTVEIALYHTLGDLPEPPLTHRFC